MLDFKNKKILIFSDSHLKCHFNQKWFNSIKDLIQKADFVIISGDFWEDKSCPFEKFIKTLWKEKLFPLLKNKTYLIHGNNDSLKYLKNPEKLRLFSLKNFNQLDFKSGSKVFHIEHGHLIAKNQKLRKNPILKFIKKHFRELYSYLKESYLIQKFIIKTTRKTIIEGYKKKAKKSSKIHIFGHIHLPKHNLKDNYIILGSYQRKARYLIIQNGKIQFFDKKIKS